MARRITDIVSEGEALGVVGGVAASVPLASTAADVSVTPAGDIAATDVQAALVELDTEKLSEVGVSDITATGTADATTYLRGDGSWSTPSGGGSTTELLHVRDEKASGTAGGTFTAGAWQTRTLNTVKTNEITGASLATNQITLPAGTYEFDWSAGAGAVTSHQTRLRDTTAGATLLAGTSESTPTSAYNLTRSRGFGRATLGVSSVIELQHRCSTTRSTDGFGIATSFGEVELYAELIIRKVS